MIVGFDIDGVLCEETYENFLKEKNPLQSYIKNLSNFTSTKLFKNVFLSCASTSNDLIYVVSYRHTDWKQQTLSWFESRMPSYMFNHINIHLPQPFQYPFDGIPSQSVVKSYIENSSKFKSDFINNRYISLYFEDDIEIYKNLVERCSNCTIVLVNKNNNSCKV